MPLWTPYDIGLQIAAQAKWQTTRINYLADVRMVNFFRLAPSMSSLPYWHRSGVACIVYVNQTDFQLHSRFQTTRWPLSSNDILHWPIFEGLLSVLTIFNAPNILPLPLIYRRKRADFVRVNETSTFLSIDFDDYLWKCVFTDSGFFFLTKLIFYETLLIQIFKHLLFFKTDLKTISENI